MWVWSPVKMVRRGGGRGWLSQRGRWERREREGGESERSSVCLPLLTGKNRCLNHNYYKTSPLKGRHLLREGGRNGGKWEGVRGRNGGKDGG